MMWEAGLGEASQEMHIGQLTEALLRDARFLSAIGAAHQGHDSGGVDEVVSGKSL